MAESTSRAEGGLFSRIASDFTTRAWVLIPIGVGINFVGGTLVNVLQLPVFLDTIGTILVALLAGPWVGGSHWPHNEPGPGSGEPDLDRLRPGQRGDWPDRRFSGAPGLVQDLSEDRRQRSDHHAHAREQCHPPY